jgi:hypothetical protein
MSRNSSPVLTREQWESRDYRQVARDLDTWAKEGGEAVRGIDATEYVAKVGIDRSGSIIVMNRAHDRVLVPPPARSVLAAFALLEQPFGFTAADLDALERAVTHTEDKTLAGELRSLTDRLRALLPPAA